MVVSKNMSLEYCDKLSLDRIKSYMVKLDAKQLKECPEENDL